MPRTAELPPKVFQAMNEQVKNELFSGYQYLAMAAYLETTQLPGAARWMRIQAQEELSHAMKFYDFIHDRSGRVRLLALPEPVASFQSPLAAFEAALANEQKVTADILELYELSMAEKDYVSHAFLQGFLTEQIEEEKSASRLVEMVRMAGDRGPALLILDKELGARPPAGK